MLSTDIFDRMPGSSGRKVKFGINPEVGIHNTLTSGDVKEAVHISNKNPAFWVVLSRTDEMEGGVVEVTAATEAQAEEIDSILGYLAARPAAVSDTDLRILAERQADSAAVRAAAIGKLLDDVITHHDSLPKDLQPGFEKFFTEVISRPYPTVEA